MSTNRRDHHRSRQGHDSRAGHRRRTQIDGPFIGLTDELLASTPWRALSVSAMRVIFRVGLELLGHGGHQADGLIVTYDQFEAYGVDRHGIKQAIDEAVFLGFLHIVQAGRGGNREYCCPNKFQLTFVNSLDTDRWHRWKMLRNKSLKEVKHLVARVRQGKQNPVWESHTDLSAYSHTARSGGIGTGNRGQISGGIGTTSYSLHGEGGRAAGGGVRSPAHALSPIRPERTSRYTEMVVAPDGSRSIVRRHRPASTSHEER